MNPADQGRLSDADLRRLVAADMGRARSLLAPGWRSLGPIGLALLLLAIPILGMGLRRDGIAVGAVRLWGLSLMQLAAAGMLFSAALVRAIPGRPDRRRRDSVAVFGALALLVLTTILTWEASPTHVPPGQWLSYWGGCYSSLIFGLPVLVVGMVLAARGFPLRPHHRPAVRVRDRCGDRQRPASRLRGLRSSPCLRRPLRCRAHAHRPRRSPRMVLACSRDAPHGSPAGTVGERGRLTAQGSTLLARRRGPAAAWRSKPSCRACVALARLPCSRFARPAAPPDRSARPNPRARSAPGPMPSRDPTRHWVTLGEAFEVRPVLESL